MNQRRCKMLTKQANNFLTILIIATLIISSTKSTLNNRGRWGSWDNCSEGDYIVKVKLRVESDQIKGDDTGLNAIRLGCQSLDKRDEYELQSLEGIWGDWGKWQSCGSNSVATGFRLRSLGYRPNQDNVAAVDFKLLCSGLDSQLETPGSGILNWGNWTSALRCPKELALCRFKTRVEPLVGTGSADDDTALNNVQMKCCKIEHPSSTCSPSYEWNTEANCNKGEHCVATFWAKMFNNGDRTGNISPPEFYEKLGYGSDLVVAYTELKSKFENVYSKIYDTEINDLINELTKTPFQVEATFLDCETAIESLVLKCGTYSVKSRVYRCQP